MNKWLIPLNLAEGKVKTSENHYKTPSISTFQQIVLVSHPTPVVNIVSSSRSQLFLE